MGGEVWEVFGVGDEGDGFGAFDGEAVGFDAVVEWLAGGEGEVADGVVVVGVEGGDGLDLLLGVFEDDGVGGEGVGGGEDGAVFGVAAVGHGFDHDVDVVDMVEVAVGEEDGVESFGVEVVVEGLDEAAWSGVDEEGGVVEVEPESSGGAELAHDDEAGAGGAEEGEGVGHGGGGGGWCVG